MGGVSSMSATLESMIHELRMVQQSSVAIPAPTVDAIVTAAIPEGPVKPYLAYLSEQGLSNQDSHRASVAALRKIGKVVHADFNIFIVETDRHYSAIYAILLSCFPKGTDLIVAEVGSYLHAGSMQFHTALRRLEQDQTLIK